MTSLETSAFIFGECRYYYVYIFDGSTFNHDVWVSDKRAVDSLFVISWTGSLIEYVLEPHMKSGTEKATDDSQLDVMATARAQWCLIRSV